MNFYRVKGSLYIDNARKLAEVGKYKEAEQLLKNFKETLENSFLKDSEFIKNLIKDIEMAVQDVNPKTFSTGGKTKLMASFKAQMQQKVNLSSNNKYQNTMQTVMVEQVKKMKSAKKSKV